MYELVIKITGESLMFGNLESLNKKIFELRGQSLDYTIHYPNGDVIHYDYVGCGNG